MSRTQENTFAAYFHEQLQQSPIRSGRLVTLLAERGARNGAGHPYQLSQICNWYSGKAWVPVELQPLLADILGIPCPDAQQQHLQQATEATSIHTALKELRVALRLPHSALAKALAPHLPFSSAPSAGMIVFWETEPGKGKSALPSHNIFKAVDPISVYGEVLRAHGLGAWFDAHAEHLRQLLLTAMVEERKDLAHGSSMRWNRSRVPEDRPTKWDEYVANRDAATVPHTR